MRMLLLLPLALLTARPAFAEDDPPLAKKLAADESVYVVQKRAYSKRAHLEVTPIFSSTLNNKFVSGVAPMLAMTYHLRENIGIELIGGYAFSRFTDATNEIKAKEALEAPDAERKWIEYFVGADIQWAPLYGKLRLVPGWLGDFDLYVLAGFGLAGTRAPCAPSAEYRQDKTGRVTDGSGVQGVSGTCPVAPEDATLPHDMKLAGHFGGGFRIFFTRWLGVRLELRDIIYSESVTSVIVNASGRSDEVSTDVRNNVFLLLGLSFLI